MNIKINRKNIVKYAVVGTLVYGAYVFACKCMVETIVKKDKLAFNSEQLNAIANLQAGNSSLKKDLADMENAYKEMTATLDSLKKEDSVQAQIAKMKNQIDCLKLKNSKINRLMEQSDLTADAVRARADSLFQTLRTHPSFASIPEFDILASGIFGKSLLGGLIVLSDSSKWTNEQLIDTSFAVFKKFQDGRNYFHSRFEKNKSINISEDGDVNLLYRIADAVQHSFKKQRINGGDERGVSNSALGLLTGSLDCDLSAFYLIQLGTEVGGSFGGAQMPSHFVATYKPKGDTSAAFMVETTSLVAFKNDSLFKGDIIYDNCVLAKNCADALKQISEIKSDIRASRLKEADTKLDALQNSLEDNSIMPCGFIERSRKSMEIFVFLNMLENDLKSQKEESIKHSGIYSVNDWISWHTSGFISKVNFIGTQEELADHVFKQLVREVWQTKQMKLMGLDK